MSTEKEPGYMSVYRMLVSIASLASPFILYFVVSIYNKLDIQGNRLTAVESTQSEIRKNVDAVMVSVSDNSKFDLVRWDKTVDKFENVQQEINFIKAVQK